MKKEPTINRMLLTFLALAMLVPWQAIRADAPINIFKRRYTFASLKWGTAAQVAEYKQILNRSKNSGYNMFCVNNGTMFHIHNQKQSWFDNFKLVKAEADRIGMPLMVHHGVQRIPSYHDLNLAEAYPVKETQFEVKGNEAVIKPDHAVSFIDGGFEEWNGVKLAKWHVRVLRPGINCVRDANEKHSGNSSVRITDPAYASHFSQNVAVKPFRAYRLTVWVKTQSYSLNKDVAFAVKGGGRQLLFSRHTSAFGWGQNSVYPTQNWKKSVIDFNSLANNSVTVQLRFAHMNGPGTGTIWVDDVSIEEVGLYEVVTRKSTQVTVTSLQSGKTYVPGTDYTLDVKAEPLYQGRMLIPAGSSIQDGELLKVNWYQLANTDHYHAPASVTCIDEYYQAMEKDLEIINEMFGGLKAVHVGAGEWRDAFWDPTCIGMHRSPGEYMASFAQRTRDMFRKINPAIQIDFKNDMYDPYHNATASLHTVNGDITGSWHGITPDLFMWNWRPPRSSEANTGDPFYKSMMLFGGLDPDHPMKPVSQVIRIFGDGRALNLDIRLALLDLAEKNGLRYVEGIIYNSWYNEYEDLELLPETCKKVGRWADNPYPGPWPVLCPEGKCDKEMGVRRGNQPIQHGLRMQSRVSETGRIHLSYDIDQPGQMDMHVVDVHGRMVYKFTRNHPAAGQYEKTWEARQWPAGVYFLRMNVGNNGEAKTLCRTSQRMVLLR